MIRKGTGDEGTRRDSGYPRKRNTKKVNMRGKTAIPPGPGKPNRRGVEIPPYVHHTAVVKKICKGGRAIARGDRGIRASPINGAIKDLIKVTTENCGDRGIDLGVEISKELVPRRVAIRCIHTTNPKRATEEREFNLQATTGNITPRVDQRQKDETKQFNHTNETTQVRQQQKNRQRETTKNTQKITDSGSPGGRERLPQQGETATTAQDQPFWTDQ